jgi:iron(III) transport system substrate-binding protein
MEEYDYTALSSRISRDMLAPQNIGVQTAALIPVIAYNTDLVPASDAPKKLVDVLNPQWKGKVGASAQSSILARIAFHPNWNPEKLKKFVASLSAQASGLLNCGEHNRLVTGEFAMFVVNCGSYAVKSLQAKGAPLGYAIPEDAATVFFWYMGVPKTSGHPNLGKLYINMVMSEEGQRIYHEGYAVDNFALPGSRSAAELNSIKSRGLPIVTVTPQFILQHPEINTLMTEIDEILRQKR